MPRVSVIIPAYNSERYITETIESVLHQTYSDVEIIIVDDGSTDSTPEVVTAIRDSRVRLISKTNGGTASARNVGIRNSTGEFIQLLDADDLILPDKLTRQVQLLDTNPTVDVVYCSFRYLYHDRCDLHAPDWLRPPSDDPYRELVKGSIFPSHAALVRRSSAEAIGLFNTELISAEDWDFWLRLARNGSAFLFHDEILVLYRQHGSSKTKLLARWRHAHVQVMENIRKSAANERELQRINWHHHASYNYVLWALALMIENEDDQACSALERAYALDADLGHTREALARRIAESALTRDAYNAAEGFLADEDSSQWLDKVEAYLATLGRFDDVTQKAKTYYWLAKASQAHVFEKSSSVRKYVWRAFRNSGVTHMNRGTFSILVQSFIGRESWQRLKRA